MGNIDELQFGTRELWQNQRGKSKETKGRLSFGGFLEDTGEGNQSTRLWQFLTGSEQKAVAVAETSKEEIFLLSSYVNCNKG